MIKVTLITLGKLKEQYLRDLSTEYIKRLSRYCDLECIELNPIPLTENPTSKEIQAALLKEKDLISKRIPEKARVYALCIEGKQRSSEAFAEEIKELSRCGTPMCFIIGSSYGLHQEIKDKAQEKLSVSKMTFPHQLFKCMFLEQLYRAFKINEGSDYHK